MGLQKRKLILDFGYGNGSNVEDNLFKSIRVELYAIETSDYAIVIHGSFSDTYLRLSSKIRKTRTKDVLLLHFVTFSIHFVYSVCHETRELSRKPMYYMLNLHKFHSDECHEKEEMCFVQSLCLFTAYTSSLAYETRDKGVSTRSTVVYVYIYNRRQKDPIDKIKHA